MSAKRSPSGPLVRIDRDTVAIPRSELEMVIRHLERFEELVGHIERRAAKGDLDPGLSAEWAKVRGFLGHEELPGSEIGGAGGDDGTYCCCLYLRPSHDLFKCETYRTWYVWAWAKCVAQALAGGMDAQLSSGSC